MTRAPAGFPAAHFLRRGPYLSARTALHFPTPDVLHSYRSLRNVDAAALHSPTPLHPSGDAGAAALRECVARSARRYLADLHGTPCTEGLYALLMREVEAPLLSEVLRWCGGNQSRAAEALGINRATLRKKLLAHGLT